MSNNQDFVIENGVLKKYKGPGGDVTIPEGVKEIGWYVFKDCTGLTSVAIPEGVTEIGDWAFSGCTGLTSVTIPESVTVIGDTAFRGCAGLTEILVDTNNSVYHSVDGMLLDEKCLLICPAGKAGNVTIPESVMEIGSGAFKGCTGLTSVAIPEGVTKIGDRAFYGCTGLTSVTIPESVTKIGWYAFEDCTGLTSVTIPEGVTAIGWSVFDGCTGLTSVTIPEGVTVIGRSAFSDCTGLTSVTIPASIEIDKSVFEGCRPVLVAPHIPISNFDKADKPGACCGFAKLYLEKAELDEEIKAGYLKYIKGQKNRLYPLAVEHEELLQLMIAEKMLVRKDIDPLLDECDKKNSITAKAAVLEYSGRNLKPVDPVKEMDREFAAMERAIERSAKNQEEFQATGVMKVGEAKKIFLYKKLEEGGLTITGYKGTGTEVMIPKAIGKDTIVQIDSYAFSPYPHPSRITPEQEQVRENLTSVTIPESVTAIGLYAFSGCTSLIIHAPAGSYAEQYAKMKRIKFEKM